MTSLFKLNEATIPFPVLDTVFAGFTPHFSGDLGALVLYLGILENGLVGAAARGEAALGRHFCFRAGQVPFHLLIDHLTARPYHPKRAAGYFSKADAGN